MKSKSKSDLENLRHSASHLLAAAILELYPEAKPTLGPPIENGFYYDFDFGKVKVSESDIPRIEKKMHEIVQKWDKFEKEIVTSKKAKAFYENNKYKKEMISDLSKNKQKISFYKSGKFTDLCGGGHIDKPKEKLKYFKILSIAGAYWRGDEKNKMLTRIYGTAFFTQKALRTHLANLEEAEKRNHRKLGQELELFAIFPEIGQGLPVWLPKGYAIRRTLENYMIELERSYGYEHILTPHIHKDKLFKISGHLGFYDDSMYAPMKIDDEKYYLKPMNCPAGMMVYKMKKRSYRDLPIKMGELGTVYRYEKSGELHGLQRVRGFTQNDAHIFCTSDQLVEQVEEVMEMMKIFYKDLGFDNYRYVLATSDPEKDKYKTCGTRKDWEWAEDTLRKVLKKSKIRYEEQKGEAAFYGPKIDVEAVNVFGKADAISTVQVDFNLPERFGLSFINKKGEEERPFVVHRALVGSFERFFAFLIEYYAGAFPVWLSPVQVKVLPITERNTKYAIRIYEKLIKENVRAEVDERNETLQAKIRDAQLEKVPYMLIVGGREEKAKKVAVRLRNEKDLGQMSLNKFIERVKENTIKKTSKL